VITWLRSEAAAISPVRALPPLYAHRLGRDYGIDSSIEALRRTLDGPVDGLESDVCLTAGGDLVLLHDPLLSLGTTLEGWAGQRTAAELCRGRLLNRHGRPSDQRPMLLSELLDAAPAELTLQLEVKAHSDPELARRTAAAICERCERDRERIEVIGFHAAACEEAAARGFRARLLIWADYAPEALAAWAVRHGVRGVSVEHFLLNERLVRSLRLAGLSVSTGTVNAVELLERVLRFGLDSVCTDRPHELRAEAIAHGLLPVSYRLPAAA
jgi:glycerophosphoryl diester phosphodiesterase